MSTAGGGGDGLSGRVGTFLILVLFRSLKLDLLSSIFQGLYPTEGDCQMVRHFITCPASLEVRFTRHPACLELK
jgi:hypothetical protein